MIVFIEDFIQTNILWNVQYKDLEIESANERRVDTLLACGVLGGHAESCLLAGSTKK